MKKLFLVVLLLVFTACDQQFNEQHVKFLENDGWHIKEFVSEEMITFDLPEEMLANYEASGISFLKDLQGREVTQFIYLLKEENTEGNPLKVVLYEADGEVIGGHGVLQNWIPDVFHLADKERLISESMIKQ